MRNLRLLIALVMLVSTASVVVAANTAFADITNSDILDNVLERYEAAAGGWAEVITNAATWLFWCLVLISMVWTFGIMALRKADLGEFFAEFIRFTVFTGFFWWLLTNGPNFADSIIRSLRLLGGNATGLGGDLTPSRVVDVGFAIFDTVLNRSSLWNPVDSTVGILMAVVVLVVLALVGVNMLLLIISGWILMYAGVFFLGFGGSRWTSDMAIGYFKTVLSIAAQLFTMVLIVGIGQTFLDDYYSRMNEGVRLSEMGVMLIVSVVLLVLVNKVPQMIGQLPFGGGSGGGIGSLGAGAAMATAGAAVGAATMAGAVALAGATNIAGGAQAIKAAFQKASSALPGDAMSFGGIPSLGGGSEGFAGSGGMAPQTPASNSATAFGGGGSGSINPPISGLSRAGRIAAGTASNLMKGAADVAKSKIRAKAGGTIGGQIAEAIKVRAKMAENGADTAPDFDNNTLQADPAQEVAAFVQRGGTDGESGAFVEDAIQQTDTNKKG